MTGPEHFREAERLIRETGPEHADETLLEIHAHVILAAAQVHATLANTAAVIAGTVGPLDPATRHEWRAAIDPVYAAASASSPAGGTS